ncbi:MAG: 2,3-bisphosphoglycerate-independent phosphoglycerate mutase, partial [Anaerolineales bacterium]|nr:2,3-bisphosphoglycerate-independent phosphoglycerate mutase [Anaerolineales bacterium]
MSKPVALFILDGWGIREMDEGNAPLHAQTPNYDRWLRNYERSVLDASGEAVGLPEGQMGNSEVGHLNLGAGRVVYQDITRINKAIREGAFFEIDVLQEGFKQAHEKGKKVHLIGLLGSGGVHSHENHMYALLKMAKSYDVNPVVHVITDGRDTPAESGIRFIKKLESFIADEEVGTIASVSGRYYAMDRDNRW